MMRAAAEPTAPSPQAESFCGEALRELSHLGLPFLLAGTYAVSAYTGINASSHFAIVRPADELVNAER